MRKAFAFIALAVLARPAAAEPKPADIVAGMTLEEKLGQLLMVQVPGPRLQPEDRAWLREVRPGGVMLFGPNIRSGAQSWLLIRELKQVLDGPHAPAFIAADQEGGPANRFRFAPTRTPQTQIDDVETAFSVASRRGREMRDLGVSMNFSPLLDVNRGRRDALSGRTFKGDFIDVADLGAAMVRGYRSSGLLSVVKHFPGLGGVGVDSHHNLPVIQRSPEAWERHLFPFREAVAWGVDLVMVAHALVPDVDPWLPVSLSPEWIEGKLRKELGFDGVVLTDDLAMNAVALDTPVFGAARLALKAGADVLLITGEGKDYRRVVEHLKIAVETGDLSEKRIDKSVERIVALKLRMRPASEPTVARIW